ncbi:microtubule-associated protein futsch isoform X1 [Brachypodium distachyon]|uniref:Uncharacterized protein n=2 Tax=Brachypodium distachyon TaxID=15368 RepID=I1IYZ4_BRADI|nr:microtubule-associated protein futsch isoform X1 [Brachypodium distachyon]KQJ83218.1 hypothetical protein BRADI_5g13737v3 [Brachypodium distachyon]|eukprot:XP_010240039.1 microtubule-associated protein futsch isoform X1 [Brachypodium distachyon]
MVPSRSSQSPPPQACSAGEVAHIALFLDTDLGTHLALNVSPGSTIRGLKAEVAMEHAAAFPDLGPVAVKSFEVLRKGARYHLSDSMAVRSAFAKVKAGCFLHVKMAAVERDTHYCRDGDRGKSSEGCLGVDVNKRVMELPSTKPEIANEVLSQGLEGGENAAVLSNVHAHAVPNDVHLSSSSQQNTERENNTTLSMASDVRAISVPIDKPKNYKQGKKLGDQTEVVYVNSTSVANVKDDSIQLENPIIAGKNKKRKKRHSVASKDVSSQEVTKPTSGAVKVPEAIDEGLPHENEGLKGDVTKHVQLLSDAQGTSDLVAEQGNIDLVHEGYKNPIIGDTCNSMCKVVAGEEKSAEGTNDGNHDEGAADEINKEKGSKSKNLLETIFTARNISQEKSCKESKRVSPIGIASIDTAEQKDQCGYGDKAPKPDIVSTQGEIVNVPYELQIASNVQQGDCNVIVEKPNGDGKQKKKRRRRSESSKDDPTQDRTKSSELVANASSVEDTSAHPLDAKQISLGTVGEATVVENDQCGHKKADKMVIVSAQGESVNDPNSVQQGGSNEVENSNSDGKQKKKRRRRSASSKDDPSQDMAQIGVATIGEAAVDENDQCVHEKPAELVIVSAQGESVNDPNNVRQEGSNSVENPLGEGKQKKKRRRRSESSKDDPTQDMTKSSEFVTNASSTENTSAHSLDAKQKRLGTIGEATVDENDQGEKAADVIVSTQGESVNDPNSVQQGDSNIIADPIVDGKRKKKRRHRLESSKDDPTQDVTKSSGFITLGSSIQNTSADPLNAKQTAPDTTGEATVSDQGKLDETLCVATANVINEVLADLRCRDSLEKGLNGDLLTEQTKGGFSASKPPKYPPTIQSDAPISSPSHKSERKQLKVLSTVLDSSHSSAGVPEENGNTGLRESDSLRCLDKISDLKDDLTETMVVPADGRINSTKRQGNQISLKHVPTDSGKAIQSLGEQVRQVAAEDLIGEYATKAELLQGSSVIETPANAGKKLQRKSKKSSKTQTPKIQEINHSAHVQDEQFTKDSQEKNVTDIGGTHDNEQKVGSPTGSPVIYKDGTLVTYDKPNARKGRKKSSKTALSNQDTDFDHGSDADIINFRTQLAADIPADAVEPNDSVAVHPVNDKINFIHHFSPRVMDVPSDSAENNEDGTIREVKEKKKRQGKLDVQSQRAGSIESNGLLKYHLPTDKTGLTDHFGSGNEGVPSFSAENVNREDDNVKKAKEKRNSKRKSDLIKPESQGPNGDHQNSDNCTENLLHSVEKKPQQSMFDAGSQTNLPIDKDHACVSEEPRNSTSQKKHHSKSRKHEISLPINGRTDLHRKVVSDLVKSFSMSPPASSQSTDDTPQNANRYRVAVRKVPIKMYEQVSDKSKKDTGERGTDAIFSDTISEGSDDVLNTISEKAAMENSSDDASTAADSGISSADRDGSDVPDDDDIVSLSQKSLKEGLHIGSILRGSTSYKKTKRKQAELLDDSEVPDSQPPECL